MNYLNDDDAGRAACSRNMTKGTRRFALASALLYALVTLAVAQPSAPQSAKSGLARPSRILAPAAILPSGALLAQRTDKSLLCATCVDFMDHSALQLMSSLSSSTKAPSSAASCQKVCSTLPSALESLLCERLCNHVGIGAFISIVNASTEAESIGACKQLGMCAGGSRLVTANIIAISVSPLSGPPSTTFNISCDFEVLNGTIGAGELMVTVLSPDSNGAVAIEGAILVVSAQRGVYPDNRFSIETKETTMNSYPPGRYLVQLTLCAGTCGSEDTLAKAVTYFTVTEHRT